MANYLYNGVELPSLPDWDKMTYPYAFIYIVTLDGTTGVYTLVVSSSSVMSYDSNGIICLAANVGGRYTVSEENWAEAADSDDFYIKRDDLVYTIWANFDVLNSDGTIYVAASEPVPIEEEETPSVDGYDAVSLQIGIGLGLSMEGRYWKRRGMT